MRALEFSRPIEIKLAAGRGEIEGYGSTFGNIDRMGETVAPGAFAASLAAHKAADTMPAMLWGHDLTEPVGVWTSASEDARGLLLTGKLSVGTQRGAEARQLAKDGALALSIGYRVGKADFVDGVRVLKVIDLLEVSLVGLPANPEARIVDVKSFTGVDVSTIRDVRAYERFLRDAGFSKSIARRLAAGWNAAIGRRDDEEAITTVKTVLKASADRFKTKG